MGLFSKKTKELVYDTAECEKKKALMRKMFDEAVRSEEHTSELQSP